MYILCYSGFIPPYSESGAVFIGLATSSDGKEFVKGGIDNDGRIISDRFGEDPYLVYNQGVFSIYFEDKSVPIQNIRRYTSFDLVNWQDMGMVLNAGTTGNFDSQDVSSPTIYIENDVWYLFYEGRSDGDNGQIGCAVSSDGQNFEKLNGPLVKPLQAGGSIEWSNNSVVVDDILKARGYYYMTFHANAPGHGYRAGILYSDSLFGEWKDFFGYPIPKKAGNIQDVMFGETSDNFFPMYYNNDRTAILKGFFAIRNVLGDVQEKITFENGFIQDSEKVYNGAKNDLSGVEQAIVLKNPKGGLYKYSGIPTATITGAIRIKIPSNASSRMMIKGSILDHSGENTSISFFISFYGSSVQTSSSNSAVFFMARNNLSVRFYQQGNIPYIFIGELNSTWRHVGVTIDEIILTHSGASLSYTSGWEISIETSYIGELKATILSTLPYSDLNQRITGYSAGDNTPISATDSLIQALGKLQAQINALK